MKFVHSPVLSGTLGSLKNGTAGIFQTVKMMRKIIDASKVDPIIISTALNLTMLQPPKDVIGEMDQIFKFVRDRIRYVADVHGVETLVPPAYLLQRGAGDCDDKVMLLAALLESIGIPTRITIVGYFKRGSYEHVFLQAGNVATGEWISMDPTEMVPLGWSPPGAVALWNES